MRSRLERRAAEPSRGEGGLVEISGGEATPKSRTPPASSTAGDRAPTTPIPSTAGREAPTTPSRLTAGESHHTSLQESPAGIRRRTRDGEGVAGDGRRGGKDRGSTHPDITAGDTTQPPEEQKATPTRRGKAPPVDPFSGETPDVIFDDWLPALQRAAAWNGWSDEEKLLQLAGHLRGRALQEWNLLQDSEREVFESAVDSLRIRLDPGSRALAAQDFRHTIQREKEPVSDFIRRLDQTFRLAYGKERLTTETRDM